MNRWEILGNRRKARKVRIKRLRPIGCWWHSRWLQSHSLARTSVRHGYISEPSPPFPCSNTPKGQLDLVQMSQEPVLCTPFFPLQQLADYSGLTGFMVTQLIDAQNNSSKGKLILPLPEAAGNPSPWSAFCYLFYTRANDISPKIPAGKQLSIVCCISLQVGSSVCD